MIQENDSNLNDQAKTSSTDELDEIVSGIVNPQPASPTIDDDFEDLDNESKPEASKQNQQSKTVKSQDDQNSLSQRKNRYQERIQQLVEEKNSYKAKYEAISERLNLSVDKLSIRDKEIESLKSDILTYKELEARLHQIESSMNDGMSLEESVVSSAVKTGQNSSSQKFLTEEDLIKKIEERERISREELTKAEKAKVDSESRNALYKRYNSLVLKKNLTDEQKISIANFFTKADSDSELLDIAKNVSKYDNAIEIIYGISKKKDFNELSKFEKAEFALKLNDRLEKERAKVSNAIDTTTPKGTGNSKIKQAQTMEEWYALRNKSA